MRFLDQSFPIKYNVSYKPKPRVYFEISQQSQWTKQVKKQQMKSIVDCISENISKNYFNV